MLVAKKKKVNNKTTEKKNKQNKPPSPKWAERGKREQLFLRPTRKQIFFLFAVCLLFVVVVVGWNIFSPHKANAEITIIILENTTQNNLLPGFQLANQLRLELELTRLDSYGNQKVPSNRWFSQGKYG